MMKKISTLFKKNPNDLSKVINEVNPENFWVVNGEGVATRKFDGTAAAIINGELYKRYDVKKGRQVPEGAIPCQEPDPITGHWPHWVKCERTVPEDKYFFEAYDFSDEFSEGTYELVGPKINKNSEGYAKHQLIPHGKWTYEIIDYSFEAIKSFLQEADCEGIVFHHSDGRMCKIRKSDFGIKRESFVGDTTGDK